MNVFAVSRFSVSPIVSLIAVAVASFLTASPAHAGDSVAVRLEESGDRAVLSNGLLTATINKWKARIESLRFREVEMLRDGYYSMDGGRDYRTPAGCRFTVKTNTPELVDVGMRRVWSNEPQAFDIEIHYVLKQGDSGLYTYALLDHPASYPAGRVGEWRMVWKLPPDLLERIFVDEQRQWEMPSSRDRTEPTPIKEITKVLSGPRAGHFDCKYDFNANYWDLGCWGHASDKNRVGAWIVLGGYEFFNDGPTKQDLTAAAGINHIHFGMNHYNGSTTRILAGQEWKKLYGPFLLYCNHSDDGAAACWADAKSRAIVEQADWPYPWLTKNADFPLAKERGTVTGRFVVHDPLKPALNGAGAWVGLAQPPPGGNWQFDSRGYQFWTKADADGRFTIEHVRPGDYTFFAFTTGAVGEATRGNVSVKPGKTLDLEDVVWNVPHKGRRIAWEIGMPDRTAKEFRHGDDYFQGYLWERFADEFPNPLEFTIGKSDWRRDWIYALAGYRRNSSAVPHRWRIHFDLSERPTGDATLTLAIASADRARIRVFVNNEDRALTEVTPAVQGGNALLREGIHAKYCVEYLKIPAERLKPGENIISLELANVQSPGAHVMFDYLNLELP